MASGHAHYLKKAANMWGRSSLGELGSFETQDDAWRHLEKLRFESHRTHKWGTSKRARVSLFIACRLYLNILIWRMRFGTTKVSQSVNIFLSNDWQWRRDWRATWIVSFCIFTSHTVSTIPRDKHTTPEHNVSRYGFYYHVGWQEFYCK